MLILSKQKFGPKKSNQSLLCCYILTVFISIWIFPIDHLLPHILPSLQGQNLAHGDLSLGKKKKKKLFLCQPKVVVNIKDRPTCILSHQKKIFRLKEQGS